MKDLCTTAAAVRLMMKYPFWCELYYSLKVIEEPAVPTLATDGVRMWVNPTFWNTLQLDHKIAALAHEIGHKMLHHCTRGLDFDKQWGNIAADIVVNTLLAKNGFKIHPNWVQPESKYDNWTFEAVYQDITRGRKKGGPGSGDPGQWGQAWDDIKRFAGSAAEAEVFERKVEEQVAKAVATAKAMGHTPAGIEMAMDKVRIIAEEKWYDHLQRYMQSLKLSEYNWARMNKRQMVLFKIVAPDVYSDALGEVVLFKDTSGSCFEAAEQARFISHINAILGEAKPSKCHVVDFDVIVHKHTEMDPGEIEFEESPVGNGGTSFRNLFPWLAEQGISPAVVIILTDMYGDFPAASEAPEYPVIWASVSPGMRAPFGEVLYVH